MRNNDKTLLTYLGHRNKTSNTFHPKHKISPQVKIKCVQKQKKRSFKKITRNYNLLIMANTLLCEHISRC